jgi:DNA repair exonuclease SbcCD ATPase subunit
MHTQKGGYPENAADRLCLGCMVSSIGATVAYTLCVLLLQDYTHILAHREGQIKTNEARLGNLVAQNEALTAALAERDATIASLTASIKAYGEKLADAKSVLEDKERLEEQVVQQMEMIRRQTEELVHVKGLLEEQGAALSSSNERNLELQMRASISKEHRIMFDDPWIVETSRHRCKGDLPIDREGQMLLSLPGVPHACTLLL